MNTPLTATLTVTREARVTYFNCIVCGDMLGRLEGDLFVPDETGQETGRCFICRAFPHEETEETHDA